MLNFWLNRTTAQLLTGISSGGMERQFGGSFHDVAGEPTSNIEWIHAPDLSAVTGQPNRYWVITGDVVTLMGQTARDALDAAEEAVRFDAIADELERAETIMRGFAEVVLNEFNARADKTNAILDAIDNATSLASLKTAIGAINDYPQRDLPQLRDAVRNTY